MNLQADMAIVANINTDFARSLTEQYARRGSLSERQAACAADMAAKARASTKPLPVDVSQTFALLERAEIRLARFLIGDDEVKLRRNKDGTSYYALLDGQHLGSVTVDGKFRVGSAYRAGQERPQLQPSEVAKALADFGANPIATMAKYGIRTGVCGVCGRRLEDPESVALGLGPVCYKRLQ